LTASEEAISIMNSVMGNATENLVQETYNQNVLGSNVENMIMDRYGGGEAQSEVIALAGSGGYFRGVGNMEGMKQYGSATRQVDAIMLLGETTETSQGYLYDRAHQEDYRSFLNTLESKDYSFYDAISGVESNSAEGQIEARDNLSQAGFGKSYAQLTQMERNYVEEIFHKNDRSGNWAGRHDGVVEDAWAGLKDTLGSIRYGDFTTDMSRNLETVSRHYGVQVSQVEAYNAYAIAMQEGADEDTLRELRSDIGAEDFAKAQEAFQAWAPTTGKGLKGSQGLLLARRPFGAIASATSGLGEDYQQAIWQEYAETGGLSGLDQDILSKLDDNSSIYKWATGDITAAEFFRGEGVEVPYGIADAPQNRITAIPEFQGALNAVVTPAGGAMPVVMVEGVKIAGSLADSIRDSMSELLLGDSNEAVQED